MRPARLVGVLSVLTVCWQVGLPAQHSAAPLEAGPLAAELRAVLQARLNRIAAGLDGVLGYALLDLSTGEPVLTHLERQEFPTASAIKLAVLYELFKQAEEGRLALDKTAPLRRDQMVGGSGILQHLTAPVLSLRDHAALMIVLSDNTATNLVIDAVGMSAVGERMRGLGLTDVRLRRKMMDLEAAQRGDENVASPLSLARTAALFWKDGGLQETSRKSALAMLHAVPGAIRAAVPRDVTVAAKTGELDGVRAEAGIVEIERRPFALAVMTTYLKEDADGVRAIREVASAAYDYFSRLARGGKYGRQIP